MKKIIAILPGDGIGPEVMVEAKKVLDKIAEKFGHEWEYKEGLIGGAAWDDFKNHFRMKLKKSVKIVMQFYMDQLADQTKS